MDGWMDGWIDGSVERYDAVADELEEVRAREQAEALFGNGGGPSPWHTTFGTDACTAEIAKQEKLAQVRVAHLDKRVRFFSSSFCGGDEGWAGE